MTKDLPDFYLQTVSEAVEASSFVHGADAAKAASPTAGDIYLATDTKKLYVCVVDGSWTGFDASILVQGILTLYANLVAGGYKITGLGDPTAAQDAATKAYADKKGQSYQQAGITSSVMNMGTSYADISGLSVSVSPGADDWVIVGLCCTIRTDTAGETTYVRILRDSTEIKHSYGDVSADEGSWPLTLLVIDKPGAGSFTYKVQGMSTDGTGDLMASSGNPAVIFAAVMKG